MPQPRPRADLKALRPWPYLDRAQKRGKFPPQAESGSNTIEDSKPLDAPQGRTAARHALRRPAPIRSHLCCDGESATKRASRWLWLQFQVSGLVTLGLAHGVVERRRPGMLRAHQRRWCVPIEDTREPGVTDDRRDQADVMAEKAPPQPAAARVAVAGATGYIGTRLVPRLVDAGYRVRCLVRSPRKLPTATWYLGSGASRSLTPISMTARRCESTSTGCCGRVLPGALDAIGGTRLRRARSRHGANGSRTPRPRQECKRIVYLGGLGETGEGLSAHLESRREVEQVLASAPVPMTALRAAMIIGSGSASFEILRYLAERLPVLITPRWVAPSASRFRSTTCSTIWCSVLPCRHRGPDAGNRRPRGPLLRDAAAHHGRGARSAPPPDHSGARADAVSQLVVDSPGHAGERQHGAAARRGTAQPRCGARTTPPRG